MNEPVGLKKWENALLLLFIFAIGYFVGKTNADNECRKQAEQRNVEWYDWCEVRHTKLQDKSEAALDWCDENLYSCAAMGNDEDGDPLNYWTDRYEDGEMNTLQKDINKHPVSQYLHSLERLKRIPMNGKG